MLLTDTTETCFQVVASQLEQEPSQKAAPAVGRAARQRRVVGAARRGRSVTEIAVEEEVAESEVRLRLHLAEQDNTPERGPHGSVLT
jgi:DNA-binding NarL/FixJ family response regulator